MLVTDWVKVGTAGKTIDGREITPDMLTRAGERYSLALYTATINSEHAFYPGLGHVAEVEARPDPEGRMALWCKLAPTAEFFARNQDKRQLFYSMELTKDFPGKKDWYLSGLAITDIPASQGLAPQLFSGKGNVERFYNTATQIFADGKEEKFGPRLAALLNSMIDARVTDSRSRSDIIAAMGRAAGIAPGTVNQILDGSIDCPPLNRLEGFARALDVSISRIRGAAEQDGCSYAADRENNSARCESCQEKLISESDTPPKWWSAFWASILPPRSGAATSTDSEEEPMTPEEKTSFEALKKRVDELSAVPDQVTKLTEAVSGLAEQFKAGAGDPKPEGKDAQKAEFAAAIENLKKELGDKFTEFEKFMGETRETEALEVTAPSAGQDDDANKWV